jgi:hypothetical protein
MLFLFLWLCSKVWSHILWYLQHCSFWLRIAILCLLFFHLNFRIFFYFCEEFQWTFDGNCIEFSWGNTAFLTIFIPPIHEHGRLFPDLLSSAISFFSALWFSLYRPLLSVCFFMFFFFWGCYEGISWFLLSLTSLLFFRKATCFLCVDFCILLLCWKCVSDLKVF